MMLSTCAVNFCVQRWYALFHATLYIMFFWDSVIFSKKFFSKKLRQLRNVSFLQKHFHFSSIFFKKMFSLFSFYINLLCSLKRKKISLRNSFILPVHGNDFRQNVFEVSFCPTHKCADIIVRATWVEWSPSDTGYYIWDFFQFELPEHCASLICWLVENSPWSFHFRFNFALFCFYSSFLVKCAFCAKSPKNSFKLSIFVYAVFTKKVNSLNKSLK